MRGGWIIRRLDQGGGFVAPAGSRKAYTRDRFKARRFDSREAADADRCEGNEAVEPFDDY
jgi:hypothetical protein